MPVITDRMLSGLRDSELRWLCLDLRNSMDGRGLDPWDCRVRVAEDYARVLDVMYERCPYLLDRVQKEQVLLCRRMQDLVSVSMELSRMIGPLNASADLRTGQISVSREHGKKETACMERSDLQDLKTAILMLHPEYIEDRSELFSGTADLIPYGDCRFVFGDGSSAIIPSYLLNSMFTYGLADLIMKCCNDMEVPVPDHRHGIISPEYVLLLDDGRFGKMYRRTESAFADAMLGDREREIEVQAYRMCVLKKEAMERNMFLDDTESAGIAVRGDYGSLSGLRYETEGISVSCDLLHGKVTSGGCTASIDRETAECIIEQLTHCYLNLHTSDTGDEGTITLVYSDGEEVRIDQSNLIDPLGAVYPLFSGLKSMAEQDM